MKKNYYVFVLVVAVSLVVGSYSYFYGSHDSGSSGIEAVPNEMGVSAERRQEQESQRLDQHYVERVKRFVEDKVKKADGGDVQSMFDVGMIFFSGIPYVVDSDLEKSLFYLKRAADQGSNMAANNLGAIYIGNSGKSVKADMEVALDYYRLSAKRGDVDGMRNLGYFLCKGRSLDDEPCKEGVHWLESARSLGDEFSKEVLKDIGRL